MQDKITIQFLDGAAEGLDVGVLHSPAALLAAVEAWRKGLGGEEVGRGGGERGAGLENGG